MNVLDGFPTLRLQCITSLLPGQTATCYRNSFFSLLPHRVYCFICSYSDGDLTLIYPDGGMCSSGFQRMTIINFECNKTACKIIHQRLHSPFFFLWRHAVVVSRMTVILIPISGFGFFPAAHGGRGSPVFAGETDCTYYFDWETAFACVKEKEDLLCQVRDGQKHYDLSPLTRFPGEFV